jgi:hypothetical protein
MTTTMPQVRKEDRVRARTKLELNQKIDTELERRIRFYTTQDRRTITERIQELDREWDIERMLETNAASLGLAGVVLGVTVSRKWFLLPFIASGFLLKHALDGWCPSVPLLRRFGVRTRMEIEAERFALKILRGDFDTLERDEHGQVSNPATLGAALKI